MMRCKESKAICFLLIRGKRGSKVLMLLPFVLEEQLCDKKIKSREIKLQVSREIILKISIEDQSFYHSDHRIIVTS